MGSACLLDLLSCGESKIFISASPLDPLVMRAEGRLKAILTSLVVDHLLSFTIILHAVLGCNITQDNMV